MRALAVTMEGYRQLANQDAVWQGSSEAVLNNVHSPDEMQPYVSRAIAAAPH